MEVDVQTLYSTSQLLQICTQASLERHYYLYDENLLDFHLYISIQATVIKNHPPLDETLVTQPPSHRT